VECGLAALHASKVRVGSIPQQALQCELKGLRVKDEGVLREARPVEGPIAPIITADRVSLTSRRSSDV
jgi:hypothetical protein